MTKLERILGTALVGVSAAYAYTAYGVVKQVVKERKFYEHLQEECEKMKEALKNSVNGKKKNEES